MKQTAIQRLASELRNHIDMPSKHFDEILEQALEIEKVNMTDFARYAIAKALVEEIQYPFNLDQIYNETYDM